MLRVIALDSGLTEDLKWSFPCYTLPNRNVVLIHGFKEYCALLFFKGALLKDPEGILIKQSENVQASRQIRFTGPREIVEKEPLLEAYIREASEVGQSGAKMGFKKTEDFAIQRNFIGSWTRHPG